MNVPTSKERSCRAVARGRDYYFTLTCIVIALPEVPHTSDGLQRIRFTPEGLASTSTRWPVWLTCLGSRLMYDIDFMQPALLRTEYFATNKPPTLHFSYK